MADASATSLAPLSAPPAALSAEAWLLEPPPAHERSGLLREESARLVDSLLVRVARGSGALDVAIGDGLGVLSVGDRTLRLGFSGIGDYARERLGLEPAAGKRMARLGQALRERPALREAVRRGEVSARKATAVLPVARGDAEAIWVERARTSTVRALEAAVRAERAALGVGAHLSERDEPWERLTLALGFEERTRVDAALDATRPPPSGSRPPAPRSRRRPRAGQRSTLSNRFVHRTSTRTRATSTASTGSSERWPRCASAGTSCSGTSPCFSACSGSGATPVSSPSPTTARSGSGWAPARSSSASPWSGGSRGGDDSRENQVGLCPAHHLYCVHRGWIRVWGRAPDGLRWELGVRADGPPLAVFGRAAAWDRLFR